jgi:hypothetical protein
MEDSADKHEGMCRSLSHRVFFPPSSSSSSTYIFFTNVMAILALGRFPGSCANAIGRHVKEKESFLQ